MNTTKLVELAATKANTTQQPAASVLNALIDSILAVDSPVVKLYPKNLKGR